MINFNDYLKGNDTKGWLVARNKHKILNHLDFLRSQPLNGTTIRHLEMHPTDVCNLACKGCSYGQDEGIPLPVHYPLDAIYKALNLFKPVSVLLSGGGEPTLYKYGINKFINEIIKFKTDSPWGNRPRLALITNGTYIPSGNWYKYLDWLRISIDASTAETYLKHKSKNMFNTAIKSLKTYLALGIRWVGAGFVYSKWNYKEYVNFIEVIYDSITEYRERINIQFRPFWNDPPYISRGQQINNGDRDEIDKSLLDLLNRRPELITFLRNNTNVMSYRNDLSPVEDKAEFCYYARLYKMLRANGDIYPCCIGIMDKNMSLGNLLIDKKLRLSDGVYKKLPYCNPKDCRLYKRNNFVEPYYKLGNAQKLSDDVRNDPMI